MNMLSTSPFFGMFLTLASWEIAIRISNRFKSPLLNPLLIAMAIILSVLKLFGIPMADFTIGGDILTLFIAPATTILAVSVYNQITILKKNLLPVIVGCTVGSAVSIATVLTLSKLFGLSEILSNSLIPKSVTTAIAIELSLQFNGIPSITILAVLITGICGVLLSPLLIKLLHVHNPVTQGLAIGTSSHLIGTSKALELGELQGAMSSIAIFIAGVATVLIAIFL
ncbi:MAG: hypothetical protein CVV52_17025 [Spirochaetae bacterium HGW-Spirochaetae-8]|nr:MAG: hypothetical protein CVV52_17025 [Spirochaetae bacterium HGW-Spirochaetae-8]